MGYSENVSGLRSKRIKKAEPFGNNGHRQWKGDHMNIIANLIKLGNVEKKRQKLMKDLAESGARICGSEDIPKVHIYNGLQEIADMIEAEVTKEDLSDYKQISFVLDGVRYYQITSSLEGGFLKLEVKDDENN